MTTLPLLHELTVYAGTTYRAEFTWKPDGTLGQDFTGWHARCRIGQAGGPARLELTDQPGRGLTLTPAGQVMLALTPAQTDGLGAGAYSYQLDLTAPGGDITRFLRGRVQVVADVGPPA